MEDKTHTHTIQISVKILGVVNDAQPSKYTYPQNRKSTPSKRCVLLLLLLVSPRFDPDFPYVERN